MTFIAAQHLASAIRASEALDLLSKEEACNEIYHAQPILLLSVLALHRASVPGKYLDMLIDLLIVVHLSLKSTGIELVAITVDEHEAQTERFAATVKIAKDLSPDLAGQSIAQYDGFVREPWLMAHVTTVIAESGVLEDPRPAVNQVVLAAYGILACIANAQQAQV